MNKYTIEFEITAQSHYDAMLIVANMTKVAFGNAQGSGLHEKEIGINQNKEPAYLSGKIVKEEVGNRHGEVMINV